MNYRNYLPLFTIPTCSFLLTRSKRLVLTPLAADMEFLGLVTAWELGVLGASRAGTTKGTINDTLW